MNRFIFALVAIVFVYIVCKCVVIPRLAKRKQAQEKDSTPPLAGNPFPFAGYYPFPPSPGMVATAPAMSARKDVYFDCTLVPLDLDSGVDTDALSAVVGSNLLELRQRGIDVVAIQIVPLPKRLLLCFSYVA